MKWQDEINEFRHSCELIKQRDGEISDEVFDALLISLFSMIRQDTFNEAAAMVALARDELRYDLVDADSQRYAGIKLNVLHGKMKIAE